MTHRGADFGAQVLDFGGQTTKPMLKSGLMEHMQKSDGECSWPSLPSKAGPMPEGPAVGAGAQGVALPVSAVSGCVT